MFIFTLGQVTEFALATSSSAAFPHQVVLRVKYGSEWQWELVIIGGSSSVEVMKKVRAVVMRK